MNQTGKFLVSALLVHAANLKRIGDTNQAIRIPSGAVSANGTATQSAIVIK